MAQLVVLICLLATPEQCSEKPVPGATAESVVTCLKTAGMAEGQQRVFRHRLALRKEEDLKRKWPGQARP
jgi:hypothetical protein